MLSLDVVIPSYRLQSTYLKAMTGLAVPDDLRVRFIIIADNPELPVPDDFHACIDGERVILIRNKENLGASRSRNAGLEYSNADWILFLDDDVIPHEQLLFAYATAIKNHPGAVGFFGETAFPEPVNSFTRGTLIGDMLFFFSYARYYEDTICITTSNVLVKRSAIGNIRFRDSFPKKGGGEDFAFFQELYLQTGIPLKSVKDAPVYHNWWHQGKRNYSQFIRWSYGDYELFRLFPDASYRSFPNVVEALILALLGGLVMWLISASVIPLCALVLGVITGELLVVTYVLIKSKGFRKSRYAPEVMLVRAAADVGRVQGIIASGNFGYFLKRPNFSGMKATRHFHFWPGIKFVAYIGMSLIIYLLLEYWR